MRLTPQAASELAQAILRRFPDTRVTAAGILNKHAVSALEDTLEKVVLSEGENQIDGLDEEFPGFETLSSQDWRLPQHLSSSDTFIGFDVLAHVEDIWSYLRDLREKVDQRTHVIFIHTNFLWRPLLGKRKRGPKGHLGPASWLSHLDLESLFRLNGFDVVSFEDRVFLPWPSVRWVSVINRLLGSLPLLRRLGMFRLYFLRQVPQKREDVTHKPSVSVVVPCKDEKGNIQRCVDELPLMGDQTELIFVEGGSTDGTKEEIHRVINAYQGPLKLRSMEQEGGPGKGPAVRTGFAAAENDILMILDSDLTVQPRELPKFYRALTEGAGDFVMGSRLVYPLEKEAMRTLNIFGNKFFSLLFSWILDQPIKDTLCGTKVLWKTDYETLASRRHIFGEFDPFGDFDLIFGAAFQGLKILEVPVRYRRRTYGDTKISRFSHGWLLLRMSVFGFTRFKLGK